MILGFGLLTTPLHAADPSQTGTFPIREGLVDIPRPDGTSFAALITYPSQPDSWAPASTLMPGLVYAHGFLTPPELYRQTYRHLASHGFLVLAPRSALEPFPSHDAYAEDIRACLDFFDQANLAPSIPMRTGDQIVNLSFQERIPSNLYGLTGHSMGGGASILAASRDERVTALVPIAAAETRPSAIAAAPGVRSPTLFLTGNRDAITPSGRHTRPMTELMTAPWAWFDLRGASHCGFVSFPLPDVVCDQATLPLNRQLALTHTYLTAFFQLHLQDDLSAWARIWGINPRLDSLVFPVYRPGLEAQPLFQRVRTPAGANGQATLTLRNDYTHPLDLHIDLLTQALPASASPTSISGLAPGQTATLTITWTQPPTGPRQAPVIVQIRDIHRQIGTHAVVSGVR